MSYSTSFEYPEPEVFTDETEYETDYTGEYYLKKIQKEMNRKKRC